MAWQVLQRLFGSTAPDPAPTADDALGPGIYRMKGVIFDPTPAKLAIVGESFRQDTLEALGGGRTERGVERQGHQATLMPEPTNPKDPAAIAVLIEGRLVGYLSRETRVVTLSAGNLQRPAVVRFGRARPVRVLYALDVHDRVASARGRTGSAQARSASLGGMSAWPKAPRCKAISARSGSPRLRLAVACRPCRLTVPTSTRPTLRSPTWGN